jgi:hypothetical protein
MLIFVGLLFFLIGLGILVSGIFSVFKVRRQIRGSAKTRGKVTGFGSKMGQSGQIFCPQVEFVIPNGQTIRFQSAVGTQPPSYRIGQQVQVIYQISNPPQAEIDSAMTLWFVPGCMLLMGLLFSGLGLILSGIGILIQVKT